MQSSTLPRLRLYRASDAPFVEKLARREFSEYSSRAGVPTVYAATLPGVAALVAVVSDEPIGFVMLSFRSNGSNSPVASLDAIAVDGSQRGRGVGKALLARAEREARRHHASELRLVTAEANVAALDLFLRTGFEIVEHKKRFYPKGQNAVVMRKKLGA
jgi:ribosomal-protein-alanine N-acetyltransferase